jgi:hypothetical protein
MCCWIVGLQRHSGRCIGNGTSVGPTESSVADAMAGTGEVDVVGAAAVAVDVEVSGSMVGATGSTTAGAMPISSSKLLMPTSA